LLVGWLFGRLIDWLEVQVVVEGKHHNDLALVSLLRQLNSTLDLGI